MSESSSQLHTAQLIYATPPPKSSASFFLHSTGIDLLRAQAQSQPAAAAAAAAATAAAAAAAAATAAAAAAAAAAETDKDFDVPETMAILGKHGRTNSQTVNAQ